MNKELPDTSESLIGQVTMITVGSLNVIGSFVSPVKKKKSRLHRKSNKSVIDLLLFNMVVF